MKLNRALTASVYVIYNNKVLLHMHKKHNTLFPLGGHMLPSEVPHETAIREVFEESGLNIKLYNNDKNLELGRVQQVNRPMHVLLENIGHDVENIDFIFFPLSTNDSINLQEGESREMHWLSKEDIADTMNIKSMAIDALNTLHNL